MIKQKMPRKKPSLSVECKGKKKLAKAEKAAAALERATTEDPKDQTTGAGATAITGKKTSMSSNWQRKMEDPLGVIVKNPPGLMLKMTAAMTPATAGPTAASEILRIWLNCRRTLFFKLS